MVVLKILAFVAVGILAFLAVAYVVMRLWNWLVPGAFNGPRLHYKYALGLLLLSRILFGGFGGGWRGGAWAHHGRHPGDGPRWERERAQPKLDAKPRPTSHFLDLTKNETILV